MADEPAARRHLRIAVGTLLSMLLLVGGVNLLVDPFGMYPTGIDSLEPFTRERRSRTFKAELLRRAEPEVVLLGSSRVETGLDPQSASLPPSHSEPGVINLGLAGSNMSELAVVFEHVLQQKSVRTVVLGVDLVLFADIQGDWHDFEQSRFAPGSNVLAYHIEKLLSARALAASRKKLSKAASGELAHTDARGFRSSMMRPESARDRFRRMLAGFAKNRTGYAHFRYTEERPALLARMARRASERGVRLIVVVNPLHVSQLVLIDEVGLRPTFERFKRDVARVAGSGALVFDGALVHGLTAEPIPDDGPMQWWWESSHFRSELGDLILASAFGGEGSDPSGAPLLVPIDARTIDAHLARERQRERARLAALPGLESWVREIARAARGGGHVAAR